MTEMSLPMDKIPVPNVKGYIVNTSQSSTDISHLYQSMSEYAKGHTHTHKPAKGSLHSGS